VRWFPPAQNTAETCRLVLAVPAGFKGGGEERQPRFLRPHREQGPAGHLAKPGIVPALGIGVSQRAGGHVVRGEAAGVRRAEDVKDVAFRGQHRLAPRRAVRRRRYRDSGCGPWSGTSPPDRRPRTTPAPGLVMNTVPSGRACMGDGARLGAYAAERRDRHLGHLSGPRRADMSTSRPLTRRATSPLASVTTGSPPGHGRGPAPRTWPSMIPAGNALTRDSGACRRVCRDRWLWLSGRPQQQVGAVGGRGRQGERRLVGSRWNGTVKAPLAWLK